MEKQQTWINLLCSERRQRVWGVCMALALIFSVPALADGTTTHEHPPLATSADDVANDPSTSNAEPRENTGAPSLSAQESHSLDHNDDRGDVASDGAHDHSDHAPNETLLKTGFGRFLVWLGTFHPAAVHFPIALLSGAALAELLSIRFTNELFHHAARFCLWLGTVGAIGAAVLGWLYGGFRLGDEEAVLAFHRWNGTGIALLALLSLWLREHRARRETIQLGAYRTVLFLTALLVGLNGYLGGLMVFGPEQHQWPSTPMEHTD